MSTLWLHHHVQVDIDKPKEKQEEVEESVSSLTCWDGYLIFVTLFSFNVIGVIFETTKTAHFVLTRIPAKCIFIYEKWFLKNPKGFGSVFETLFL